MKSWSQLFFAATVMVLISSTMGCTVDKKDPINKHVGPPPPNKTVDTKRTDSNLGSLDLNALYEKAQKSNVNLIEEILSPLYQELFSEARLKKPELQAERQTLWALQFFNEILVSAHKKTPKNEKLVNLLKNYRALLVAGCRENSLNDCDNFFFFKKDPNTVAVIKIILLGIADVKEYFRMIYIAYELSNRQPDDELTRLSFARTMDLLKAYIRTQKGSQGELVLSVTHLTAEEAKTYRLHLTVLNLLANSGSTESKVSGLKSQSNELMAWMASPNFNEVLGSSFALELNKLVSDWLKSPEVWQGMIQGIRGFENNDPHSYSSNLKNVPGIMLERLNVKKIDLDKLTNETPRSLVGFYFINRIFALKPLSQELYLWHISDKKPKETAEFIQAAVKMQFLANVQLTNKIMSDFFKLLRKESRPKEDLLELTIKNANEKIGPIWADFFARTARLESFFSTYLEQSNQNSTDAEVIATISETRRMFTELNANVKYMVTYPNMIMLGYFATIFDYRETVPLPTGQFLTIDKDLFLSDLLNGKVGPLFILTSYKDNERNLNYKSLDKIETMWAFHFMIEEDLLALYDVKLKDFLAVFFRKYKDPNDTLLRTWVQRLADMTRRDAPLSRTFAICDSVDTNNNVLRTFEFDLNVRDIYYYTFLSEPSSYQSPEPIRTAVNALSNTPTKAHLNIEDAVEVIRSDVDPKLRRLALLKVMINNLPASTEKNEALEEIAAQFKETNDLKKTVLDQVQAISTQSLDCLLKISQIELSRQMQMTKMEIKYAEDVYSALAILRGLQQKNIYSPTLTLAELKLKEPQNPLFLEPRFSNVPDNMPIMKALNEWLAQKTALDEIFRLNTSYRTDYSNWAAIQRDSDGKFYFNNRSTDFALRAISYLRFGYDNVVLTPKPDRSRVNYPTTAKQLKAVASSEANIVAIYGDSSLENFQRSFVDVLNQRTMWFQNQLGLTSVLRHLEVHQVALHKIKFEAELDLQKIADCDEACLKRESEEMKADSRQFIETSNRFLQRFSLTPEKIEFLKWFNSDTFFDIDNGNSIFYRGPVALFISTDGQDSYIGAVDDYFTFVTSRTLGASPQFWGLRDAAEKDFSPPPREKERERLNSADVITRPDIFADAREFSTTLRDENKLLLFEIDAPILQAIRHSSTYLVQREMMLAHSLEAAIADWQTTNSPVMPMHFSTLRPVLERPELLSPTLLGGYLGIMRRFNDETGGQFLPPILKGDSRWYSGK